MIPDIYAFFNAAGEPLRVISQTLIDREPNLAARLLPVSPDAASLAPYRLPPDSPRCCRFAALCETNEVAWIFYPAKLDRVVTAFSFRKGVCCVEKRVLNRARRPVGCPYRQREIPPEPLVPGAPVSEMLKPFVEARDWASVETTLERFFKALLAAFPLDAKGMFPSCTLDAVPRNCMLDEKGVYRFFDLEYDLAGGVPPTYPLFSGLKADVVRLLPKSERDATLRNLYAALCMHLGLTPQFDKDAAIALGLKRFNTESTERTFRVALLSLIPVKRWRRRWMWWSDEPSLLHR